MLLKLSFFSGCERIPALHPIETQYLSFVCRDTIGALDDVNVVVPRIAKSAIPSSGGMHR